MQYVNRTSHGVIKIVAIVVALVALTSATAFAQGRREAPQRPGYDREGARELRGEYGEYGRRMGHHGRGRGHGYGQSGRSWDDNRSPGRGGGPHHEWGDGRTRGWGGRFDDRFDELSEQERISAETAQQRLEQAVAEFGDGRYEIVEIMEFENDFYAQVRERGSDTNAFELLVDAYTGRVFPEPGPNMMWNTEYGHMGRGRSSWGSEIDSERAEEIASDYVAQYSRRASVGDTKVFPGYYTMHVFDDGEIVGMLSVNARSGRVWYHDWHGAFRQMLTEH